MWTDETLKPLPDTLAINLELEDMITPLTEALTRLTDTVDVVMLLMDMDILVTLLLEDLAREVEEEVLDALTRPALSNSTTSAPTTSTTTSYSMPKPPYRASIATLEAMVATDGAKRREGT